MQIDVAQFVQYLHSWQYWFDCGMDRREVVGDWEEFIHPLGATYYYNARRVSIGRDISTCILT